MGRPSGRPRSLQRRRRAQARPTGRRARLWVGLQADGVRRESPSCGGAKRNAPVDDRGVVLGGCLTMTYFRARMRTIIGVLPFHGPVRDGKGWCRQAMVVRRRGESESSRPRWWARAEGKGGVGSYRCSAKLWDQAARAISTGQLNALPRFHIRPINVVVCHDPSGGSSPREISSSGTFPA